MRPFVTLSAAGLVLALAHAAPAVDVTDVLGRMRSALEPGKDMRAAVELTMTNPQGERVTWTGKYYRMSGAQARKRLVFESPLDLRGTSMVFWRQEGGTDRVRIYLPFVRRVRELQADMRGESFLGTDFNFEDLGFEEMEFQQHALRGEREFDNRPCWDVESVPDKSWWYGRVTRCIDKKDYLPRRTEYYDPAGRLYKIRSIDRVERLKTYTTPTVVTMDVVPTQTSSRIAMSDVEYDVGLTEQLFEAP